MLNRVILIGRLTADPDLKQTATGTVVTSFNIAVERDYKSGDTKQTDFITVVAWRKTAEFISKYFIKGRMIAIEGRIETRDYTDKEGNKRKVVEVVAEHAYFCGDAKKAEKSEIEIDDKFEEIPDDEELPW